MQVLEDPKVWDQTAFNDLARRGHTHSDPAQGNLWKGDRGKLTIGVLPASIFASGHMFFVQVGGRGKGGWVGGRIGDRVTCGRGTGA